VAWMMCEVDTDGPQDGNACRPCGNGYLRILDCLLRDRNREVEGAQEYSLVLTPACAGENFRLVPEIESQL